MGQTGLSLPNIMPFDNGIQSLKNSISLYSDSFFCISFYLLKFLLLLLQITKITVKTISTPINVDIPIIRQYSMIIPSIIFWDILIWISAEPVLDVSVIPSIKSSFCPFGCCDNLRNGERRVKHCEEPTVKELDVVIPLVYVQLVIEPVQTHSITAIDNSQTSVHICMQNQMKTLSFYGFIEKSSCQLAYIVKLDAVLLSNGAEILQFPMQPELQTQQAWLVLQQDSSGQTVEGVQVQSIVHAQVTIIKNKPIRLIIILLILTI